MRRTMSFPAGTMKDTSDASIALLQDAAGGSSSTGGQYTAQQNMQARQLILANAREMFQQVGQVFVAAPLAGGVPQPITVQLRNVGLVKRLVVHVTATVAQSAAENQILTQFGLSNIFSNINVTDLSNYQRINTTGWHLHFLATLRRQAAYGAAFLNDSPVNISSNFAVNASPAVVTAAKNISFYYELPLAYSDTDLRGAIFSAVVNSTWQVQFQINPNFFVATGADATGAVYQSSTAALGALTNMTITIYQIYLDQLPYSGNNPILPLFDLATGYLISQTNQTGLSVGQDFPIQYPNFRQILSTFFVYDNLGVLNAGTDLNYVGIQAANLVFLYKTDPFTVALKTRNTIGDDWPRGTYCLETRAQPINTTAYGNMQLVLNPSAVTAGANVLVGLEMLGIINQVANAGSLAGN
jgi:hypothetical protein